nr:MULTISPECIES: transposase [Brenneria]
MNDNLLFKWRQRWREGALCPPGQTLLPQPAALLPIEVIPEPASSEETHALPPATPSLASAASCRVEFRHGNMTLENLSPELLSVLTRELTGRAR